MALKLEPCLYINTNNTFNTMIYQVNDKYGYINRFIYVHRECTNYQYQFENNFEPARF